VIKVFFLFATASRPALGSIQPPVKLVTRALSAGVKQEARDADHSLPYSVEVKNIHSTIHLHGVGIS
jgi:hypothetical protein